jgi:hypothetical protein
MTPLPANFDHMTPSTRLGTAVDLSKWTAYLSAAKTALDIFKGIRAEIPKGPKADEAQRQIERAEQALKVSEVELAKAFGYNLCQCTFPPSVMLWSEKQQAHLCPNPNCRCRIERPKPVRVARRLGARKVL